MTFELDKAIEVLERTPKLLKIFLTDLSDNWIYDNEGVNTWSPFDIVGHLIHGEKTDWMVRCRIILRNDTNHKFEEFDRFAQFENSKKKSMTELLNEFEQLRTKNIKELNFLKISNKELDLKGIHPEFRIINLRQLISTWVVHDLGHIAQITRVMAKQYKDDVGPWIAYLGVLK
jgi:hypothetical protein